LAWFLDTRSKILDAFDRINRIDWIAFASHREHRDTESKEVFDRIDRILRKRALPAPCAAYSRTQPSSMAVLIRQGSFSHRDHPPSLKLPPSLYQAIAGQDGAASRATRCLRTGIMEEWNSGRMGRRQRQNTPASALGYCAARETGDSVRNRNVVSTDSGY
jgi:hypothetical protein